MRLWLPAYAKVNLGLEILGRRADGFHEIVSVTQTISLADTVEVAPAETLALEMTPPLVDDSDNLVVRAAEALAAHTGHSARGRLHLKKRIPLAAGLGGGSSDAATTLRLLDRLWETRLGPRGLGPVAAALGSDVSLFLVGGTSLIRGRGEHVEALPPVQPCWLVLVCPDSSPPDKTRALYRALQPSEWGDGSRTLALADAIRDGRPLVETALVNGFDRAADRVYPQFPELRTCLHELTGQRFHLTGAGPTLFGLFSEATAARHAARRLGHGGMPAHVARTVARQPAIRASHG
jgi:4-diphosphocytidyl-2-C-methyl-D-erythritol kinase